MYSNLPGWVHNEGMFDIRGSNLPGWVNNEGLFDIRVAILSAKGTAQTPNANLKRLTLP